MDSMSIGYNTTVYEMDNERDVRLLKQVELYEISLVTEPANALATITNVKTLEIADSIKTIENILRNNGFSQSESKLLISKVKQLSIAQREAEEVDEQKQREVAELLNQMNSTLNILKV